MRCMSLNELHLLTDKTTCRTTDVLTIHPSIHRLSEIWLLWHQAKQGVPIYNGQYPHSALLLPDQTRPGPSPDFPF